MFDVVLRTIWISLAAAACATCLAAPFAYAACGWPRPLRRAADALLCVPMVLPPTVVGFALLWSFGRQGPAGRALHAAFGGSLVFTPWAAVLAAAVVSFPLVYRAARAAFERIDPQLGRAARTLGLGGGAIFWRVSLPLAAKGVGAGAVLGFARAMGEFGATMMVAGNIPGKTQTLPLAVYESVQGGRDSEALALCGVALAVGVGAVAALEWLQGGEREARP